MGDFACDCPFCRQMDTVSFIAADETGIAFYDKYPVAKGHALIIPRRHVADYFDLTQTEQDSLWQLVNEVKVILEQKFHPDGYNIGVNIGEAAGQSVFHVHLHIIPRYKGDVVNPKGGIRGVIPDKQKYGTA